MLVLGRLLNQDIVFTDRNDRPIGFIRVCDIYGDKVRLGFELPAHIKIKRREIHEQDEREKRAADGLSRDGIHRAGATQDGMRTQDEAPRRGGLDCGTESTQRD